MKESSYIVMKRLTIFVRRTLALSSSISVVSIRQENCMLPSVCLSLVS